MNYCIKHLAKAFFVNACEFWLFANELQSNIWKFICSTELQPIQLTLQWWKSTDLTDLFWAQVVNSTRTIFFVDHLVSTSTPRIYYTLCDYSTFNVATFESDFRLLYKTYFLLY